MFSTLHCLLVLTESHLERPLGLPWDGAKVKSSGKTGYWQRRTIKAIHIKLSEKTMNLDSGVQLPTVWNPVLKPP